MTGPTVEQRPMSGTETAYQQAIALARSRDLLGWSTTTEPSATAHLVLPDAALGRRDFGRYLFILANYLHAAGLVVHVTANKELIASLASHRFARMLLETDQIRLVSQQHANPDAGIVLHDGCIGKVPVGTLKEIILVRGRRLTMTPEAYDVLFPYMLHPKYYANGDVHRVERLRGGRRTYRLLFAGNVSDRYANPEIWTKYRKLDRVRTLQRLRSELSADEMTTMTGTGAEPGHSADPSQVTTRESRFVLIDTSNGCRIAKHRWLPTLSQCDFVLACPGVDMPLSHHLVEAMAVGAIPLTQCADFFDPPLQHGYECIAHDGHDVATAVRAALAMPAAEVLRMREHVLAHYERFLTPEAFARRVLRHPGRRLRLGLNFMPSVDRN